MVHILAVCTRATTMSLMEVTVLIFSGFCCEVYDVTDLAFFSKSYDSTPSILWFLRYVNYLMLDL